MSRVRLVIELSDAEGFTFEHHPTSDLAALIKTAARMGDTEALEQRLNVRVLEVYRGDPAEIERVAAQK